MFDNGSIKNNNEIKFLRRANEVSLGADMLAKYAACLRDKTVSHYRDLGPERFKFMKQVIRKMTSFQTWPVIDDQNRYNDELLDLVEQLMQVTNRQQQMINTLTEHVSKLEEEAERAAQD